MSAAESKQTASRKKYGIVLAVGAALVILLVFVITQSATPKRSVVAYCNVYRQEKARLSAMSNNSHPYPSGVFNVSVTDASEIATSFDRLSPVAPKEVDSMVNSLQKLYQDMHENPSHAITNALNGGSLDDSLKEWTATHCSQ